MVRRLKQDLRDTGDGDFPQRKIIPISIEGLPVDAPELVLAQLLQQYRTCREQRLKDAPKSTQNTAKLVITSLQKRLLSSIEAFARTLKVHRASIERQAEKQRQSERLLAPCLVERTLREPQRDSIRNSGGTGESPPNLGDLGGNFPLLQQSSRTKRS